MEADDPAEDACELPSDEALDPYVHPLTSWDPQGESPVITQESVPPSYPKSTHVRPLRLDPSHASSGSTVPLPQRLAEETAELVTEDVTELVADEGETEDVTELTADEASSEEVNELVSELTVDEASSEDVTELVADEGATELATDDAADEGAVLQQYRHELLSGSTYGVGCSPPHAPGKSIAAMLPTPPYVHATAAGAQPDDTAEETVELMADDPPHVAVE